MTEQQAQDKRARMSELGLEEWVPIHDANKRLLFELSLVTCAVRIKARDLTTVVDVERERAQRLRALAG